MAKTSNKSGISILSQIRKTLNHTELAWSPQNYLDTGIADLNRVFGHPEKGLPYGRPIEISGMESMGKTALVLTLAGIAQQRENFIVWIDFENSYDEDWVTLRGVDTKKNFLLLQTYEGTFDNEKEPRVILGSELCDEMEKALPIIHKQGNQRIFLVMDSIPAILLPNQVDEGFKSNMALANFLSQRFRKWVPQFRSYNVLPVFINQLRQNPMQMWGSPWYSPGGNAQKFYYHSRVRVQRTKGGKVNHMGKQVGIQGIITNTKNKSGGIEGSKVGYKIFFDGRTEFLDHKQLAKDE